MQASDLERSDAFDAQHDAGDQEDAPGGADSSAGGGVTVEEVGRAAAALEAEGEVPSIRKLLARIGRGSHTTLARHLRQWQHTRRQAAQVQPTGLLSEAFRAALAQELARLQQLARRDADARLAELEAVHAGLTEAAAAGEAQVDELTEALAAARREAAGREEALRDQLAASAARCAQVADGQAALEAARQTAQADAEAARLAAAEARIRHDSLQASHQALQKEHATLRDEVLALRERVSHAERELAVAAERARGQEARATEVTGQRDTALSRAAALEADLHAALARAAAAEQAAEVRGARLEIGEQRLAEATEALTALRAGPAGQVEGAPRARGTSAANS